MFHFQIPVTDWPRAVAQLPDGYVIKAIDDVQMLAESKSINPNIDTILRHYYADQVPGVTVADNIPRARDFFNSFIDDTFINGVSHGWNHAAATDYIEEWNETFGNTQSADERWNFINWSTAAAIVWKTEFRTRPGLEHIKLILANTAIGNDIPMQIAQVAVEQDAVIGYHPYWPVSNNQVLPGEWQWYSGRWTEMDQRFRNNGYTVNWAFTEAGSVRYWVNPDTSIGLDPYGGWKHQNVHGGNLIQYLSAIDRWMNLWYSWNEDNNWRALPPVLFSSHNDPEPSWRSFNLVQPQLDAIAQFVANWQPQQPPDPPENGEPRIQYFRVYNVIPPHATLAQAIAIFEIARANNLETVGYSYDDAGIGALDNRLARLWGISASRHQEFLDWYMLFYPGVVVEFVDLPI